MNHFIALYQTSKRVQTLTSVHTLVSIYVAPTPLIEGMSGVRHVLVSPTWHDTCGYSQ